jgi:hypothetical protein
MAQIIKPKKWLPELPRYTLAGGKLKTRNPKVTAHKIRERICIFKSGLRKAITNKELLTIKAVPAAKPSIMSNKLKALVIPKIQKNVTTALPQNPRYIISVITPREISKAAQRDCTKNFCRIDSSFKSSRMPKNSIKSETPRTANILVPGILNTYTPKQEENTKAAAIPKPPTKETPFVCSILYFKEIFANKNMHSILEIKAPEKTIKYLSIFPLKE